MSLTDRIKSAGTIVVTILIFVFVAGWAFAVWQRLGTPPVYLKDGTTVSVDEFARAKDLFVLVFPLLTTAAGYWLGSQGTTKAEEKAKKAEAKKDAVLSESQPGIIEKARAADPDAFKTD
jgi:hypothetical protein